MEFKKSVMNQLNKDNIKTTYGVPDVGKQSNRNHNNKI